MKYISIIILLLFCGYQGWSQGDTTIVIKMGDMELNLKIDQKWIESKMDNAPLKEIVVNDSDVKIKIDTSARLKELIRIKNSKRVPEYKRTFSSDEAMLQGKAAAAKQLYEEAINYYFAAEAFRPEIRDTVQLKVNEAFKEINDLKNEALIKEEIANLALIEAKKQTKIAIKEKREADRQRGIAVKQKREADRQRKIAEENEREAIRQKKEALRQQRIAEEQRRIAELEGCRAIEQTKIAEVQRARAERLRIEALSKALALKSSSFSYDNQDTAKTFLAIEAYNMQKTVNDNQKTVFAFDDLYRDAAHQQFCVDILDSLDQVLLAAGQSKGETAEELLEQEGKDLISPEIYTGLHDALIKLKGSDFDEVKIEEGREDIVRSIIQTQPKIFYTVAGGRLIKWDVNDWNEVGRPSLDAIEVIQDRRMIDMSIAIVPGSERGGDLIAVGGKHSDLELINSKGKAKANFALTSSSIVRKNRKQWVKNPNYNFEKYTARDLDGVFDMALDGKKLYMMGRYGRIQTLNTESGKIETVKELYKKSDDNEKRAEQIAISSNDKLMAVGYKDGRVDVLDMSNFNVKYDLSFLKDTLKGKITDLTFNEENGELAVGTGEGYVAVLSKTDNGYSENNIVIRDAHPTIINAIDFHTITNKDGEIVPIMGVASNDKTVSIWRMNEFDNALYEPFVFDDKSNPATSLEFIKTPNLENHNQVVVGYADGTVKFWTLEIERLADELRCTANSVLNGRTELNDHEKEKYHTEVGIDIKDYTKCGE